MKRYAPLLIIFLFLLASCGSNDEDQSCAVIPDTSEIEVNLNMTSLVDSLMNIQSKRDFVSFLDRHVVLREAFFKRGQYPDDSVFINTLYKRFTNIHFDTLGIEVNRVFGNQTKLKEEFTLAFKNLKHYYPEVKIPRIETALSGFETDMVVSDTLIIIGLDFYLGKDARFRPNMYEYMLRQYNPENIVPSTMLLYGIDDRINKTEPENKTALADMIAYGKSFYFAKQMVPCTPDSVLIWYSGKEIEGARKNQDLIWARFIEDKLLYATNHVMKQRYLGDRPKTVEVGVDCPGRIAQWVGWQIVKSYMKEHPDETLSGMMNTPNAEKILRESKYKARRE